MKKIIIIFTILSFSFFISGCASLIQIAGLAVAGYGIYESTQK